MKGTYTIRLSVREIEALMELAMRYDALAACGKTSGKPSWRVLVSMIGRGKLSVSEKIRESREPRKKRGKKPFLPHPRYSPGWWQPGETEDMPAAAAAAASGYSVEELEAGGLVLVDDGRNLISPSEWYGWVKKVAAAK
jgi:hypothetical protein